MLIAESENKIIGFIIGKIIKAPEVYDPLGLTLMIDDFCIETENDWHLVGTKLVEEIKNKTKAKNISQILIVCGGHDEPKRLFLKSIGLNIASEILPSPLASNAGTQSAVCTARTKFFLVVILPSASGVIIELSSASIISVP